MVGHFPGIFDSLAAATVVAIASSFMFLYWRINKKTDPPNILLYIAPPILSFVFFYFATDYLSPYITSVQQNGSVTLPQCGEQSYLIKEKNGEAGQTTHAKKDCLNREGRNDVYQNGENNQANTGGVNSMTVNHK